MGERNSCFYLVRYTTVVFFKFLNEMGKGMCLGRNDTLEDQQAFEGFFCCLFAVKAEILIHDIGRALSLPGTGKIAPGPDEPRFSKGPVFHR